MAFELDALAQRQQEDFDRGNRPADQAPAGIPWFVWVLGGIGLLIVILLIVRSQGSAKSNAAPIQIDDTTPSNAPGATNEGGGSGSSGQSTNQPPISTASSPPPPSSSAPKSKTPTTPTPPSHGSDSAKPPTPKYITVQKYPAQDSTLSGIAKSAGVTLAEVEALNAHIYQERHSWDMLYPGEQVRVV